MSYLSWVLSDIKRNTLAAVSESIVGPQSNVGRDLEHCQAGCPDAVGELGGPGRTDLDGPRDCRGVSEINEPPSCRIEVGRKGIPVSFVTLVDGCVRELSGQIIPREVVATVAKDPDS